MTIEQTDVIDFVGMEKNTNRIVLTISDHLSWEDVDFHYRTMTNKINAYIQCIESGEIYNLYPDAKGKQFLIDIVSKNELPLHSYQYFQKVRHICEPLGIQIRSRVPH